MRKKIDNIDNDLIILLKKRFIIVKKLGKYKGNNGIKIRDKKREGEIIKKITRKSRLNSGFVKKLYLLIFKESRRLQK